MAHEGEQFLHRQDSGLQRSLAVELEQIQREQAGREVHTKPVDKIADWLEVLEHTHTGKGHTSVPRGWERNQPEVLERIKASYHKQYVIKEEDIPEAVYQAEARIARRLGHGDVPVTHKYRQRKAAEVITNQQTSLDRWVDYLSSADAPYPTWAKYWAFTAVTHMGRYEKQLDEKTGRETARFAHRDASTAAPFPPLNARALALSIGVMEAKLARQALPKDQRKDLAKVSTRLDEAEFKQLVSTESFSHLYAQFLLESPAYSTEGLRETRGEWVKYHQGSDPTMLVNSLQGHPLEWCTANPETARLHLKGGDFHVYYSYDQAGQATIPRVAIRMEDGQIAEVRGIAPDQNLDPFIGEVVRAKMTEFPDGAEYQKKAADMDHVTAIEDALAAQQPLSPANLRFLYEVDGRIEGFGYGEDPRIKALRNGRDFKQDLTLVFNCEPEQISTTKAEALSATPERPIIYHRGHLALDIENAQDLSVALPRMVSGALILDKLSSTEGLVLPEVIGGSLSLKRLKSAAGLTIPTVRGGIHLDGLTDAHGLELPPTITGNLNLLSLTEANGLVLPSRITGVLNLSSLVSARGLDFSQTAATWIYLSNLQSAEGLRLPLAIAGGMELGITSADGLQLPEVMGGSLNLSRLASADGLQLPRRIEGSFELGVLRNASGLQLPEYVQENLDLPVVTSAEGLTLPAFVGGLINLGGVRDLTSINLPEGYKRIVFVSPFASPASLEAFSARYPEVSVRTV
jgi:hypothetical protein